MTLPVDFQFSQASLQDYVDCPRRFQLRYVQRQAWPAVEAEPALENERYLQQGAVFHRLVHQHVLGIPAQRLSATVQDDDLRRWWRHYLDSGPVGLPKLRHPEVVLSAPLAGYRLLAQLDLVAVEPGRQAVILDWKTSRRRPQRRWLADRLQTRVYPFLLIQAGTQLNGGQPLRPEQVEMIYWFADFPTEPERFVYEMARFEADRAYLASLIGEITDVLERGDLPLTAQERRCRYCVYRSLCQRGVGAGRLDEGEEESDAEEGLDLMIDLEQIGEIEY